MDRGAWWATVHGVSKSWTWLKWLSMHAYPIHQKISSSALFIHPKWPFLSTTSATILARITITSFLTFSFVSSLIPSNIYSQHNSQVTLLYQNLIRLHLCSESPKGFPVQPDSKPESLPWSLGPYVFWPQVPSWAFLSPSFSPLNSFPFSHTCLFAIPQACLASSHFRAFLGAVTFAWKKQILFIWTSPHQ